MREGFRRGVRDGSRTWRAIGAGAAAIAVVRWIITEPEETVFSEEVKPGEGIEIRTVRRDDDPSSGKKARSKKGRSRRRR
jgi:hypothetical protein